MDVAVEDHAVKSRTPTRGYAPGQPVRSPRRVRARRASPDRRLHRRRVLREPRARRLGVGGGAGRRAAGRRRRAGDDEPADGDHRRARGAAGAGRRRARSSSCPTRRTSSTASATSGTCGGQANGWRNAKKQPVANADLWRPLIELVVAHDVTFRWVKGHSGDRLNDLVDAAGRRRHPPPRLTRLARRGHGPDPELFGETITTDRLSRQSGRAVASVRWGWRARGRRRGRRRPRGRSRCAAGRA